MRALIPTLFSDPYRVYELMRRRRPVLFVEELDLWIVFRYADVRSMVSGAFVSNDRRNIRTGYGAPLADDSERALLRDLEKHMLLSEGPEHTRRRSAVARFFSPKMIENLKPTVDRLVDALLDRFQARRSMDFMADFARQLPVHVIAGVIGLPTEDLPRFKIWTDALVVLNDPVKTDQERIEAFQTMPAMKEYFDELFARRRREPREDLITALACASGDAQLTPEEMVATCSILMAAGHETVMHTLGNGLLSLEAFPKQKRLLRDDPSLVPTAVEELLRYSGPVQFQQRQTVSDYTLADKTIPGGAVVMPAYASANRDADAFEAPDELQLGRMKNPHMAFGHGRHHCIGAALARTEMRSALGRLFARFPSYEVDLTSMERRDSLWMRGLNRITVHC